MIDALRTALVDLVLRLKPEGIELIVGGGYGLLLRSEHVATREQFSRYGLNAIVRSTRDLDCFLAADIITDGAKTQKIAEALAAMGFTPVQNYWQFRRPLDERGEIHIDLLAADVPSELTSRIERPNDKRRLRPRDYDKLHGRRTPEAVTIQHFTTKVDASGDSREAFVQIPHPVSSVLMKLFAFRDRITDERHEYGAYHAFDVLQLLDSMNETEWKQSEQLLQLPEAATTAAEARRIVNELFESEFANGSVRLVEYARDYQSFPITTAQLSRFIGDLRDLLQMQEQRN